MGEYDNITLTERESRPVEAAKRYADEICKQARRTYKDKTIEPDYSYARELEAALKKAKIISKVEREAAIDYDKKFGFKNDPKGRARYIKAYLVREGLTEWAKGEKYVLEPRPIIKFKPRDFKTIQEFMKTLEDDKEASNKQKRRIDRLFKKYKDKQVSFADLANVYNAYKLSLKEANKTVEPQTPASQPAAPQTADKGNVTKQATNKDEATVEKTVKKNVASEQEKPLAPTNVRKNKDNINKCNSAILNGHNFSREKGKLQEDIHIGNMYASSNIGNDRIKNKNQEDAVLLIQHPDNEDFKMMVVADGMGGHESGEKASAQVVKEIKEWFKKLDLKYYDNEKSIGDELKNILNEINENVREEAKAKGDNRRTTFVGAIHGKNETVVGSVGDSRAYIVTEKGKLEQITRDDSEAQMFLDLKWIDEKDDMRFLKNSNRITQSIGSEKIEPHVQFIENKYRYLLLTSDGVSDCLSDRDIGTVTRETDFKELARKIVEKALTTESALREELKGEPMYDEIIPAGKDNTTAAVMGNNREGGR